MAPRAVIIGSGTEIAPNRVTNDMLARLMDTSDEWIKERSGVETRYYVDPGTGTSDLGVAAARRALEQARVAPEEIDLVVFATMTPDHYFPGAGALLQSKLGPAPRPLLRHPPAVRGLPLRYAARGRAHPSGARADGPAGRRGDPQRVHAVGRAPVGLPLRPLRHAPDREEREWNTRFRHLTVLFGDAGAAVVLRAHGDGAASSTRACTRTGPTTTSSTCRAPGSSTGPTWTRASWRAATTSR
jgi:3-oxoacyl-[acyl-carrier-protein] synthase-3